MPSDTATSPTYGSPPRPSTIVPPLISRSKVITGLYGGVGRSCQDVAVIDHFGINCADLETAKAFYDRVLGVLGYSRQMDFGVAIGYGKDGHPDFWIADGNEMGPNREIHVAFQAADSAAIRLRAQSLD